MPLTNYHLGISLLIGYLLRRKINWLSLILSSLIVDVEPLIILLTGANHPLHGLLHTFLMSIPAGALVGLILYVARGQMAPYLADLAIMGWGDSLRSFILAGIIGWASHILLDLPLYPEMKPFYPLNTNPIFVSELHQIVFYTYDSLFIMGVLVYPIHLYRELKGENMLAADISVGLVLIGLGTVTIPSNLLYAGFLLDIAGLFMLIHGLKRTAPNLSRRLLSSFIMLAAASLLIHLLVGLQMSRLPLEQYISVFRPNTSIIFMGAYILSLIALALMWPALRLLQKNISDRLLSLSFDLLVAGWILAPLFIPLLIAAAAYVLIIVRAPHMLKLKSNKH